MAVIIHEQHILYPELGLQHKSPEQRAICGKQDKKYGSHVFQTITSNLFDLNTSRGCLHPVDAFC